MSNLDLWDRVRKTDPENTKYVNQRGGYTSIKPQSQIMAATEEFGKYGSGWGFESIDLDMSAAEALDVVLVRAVFFYIDNGEKKTFPINNSWPIRSGSRVDTDFAKKAETNTMGKALSKLGFNADIFMGEYDDPDYVQAVGDEYALEKAEDKIEEKAKQEAEYAEWVASASITLAGCVSMNELKGVYAGMVRKARLYKDDASVMAFTKIKDQRKEELESKSNDKFI